MCTAPDVEGTRTFQASADAYDAFMGRYSRQLADVFADLALPASGGRFLDVGCGPGAVTAVAVTRLGAPRVAAVDPSPGFVAACRERHPGVDVRCAPAERLPFEAAEFDAVAAQLVFHFVSDPQLAAAEMRRVIRPGGTVAAASWDATDGPRMLQLFWEAARAVDPVVDPGADNLHFGGVGELAALFLAAGLRDVHETTAAITSRYQDFDELWTSLLAGIGPAGAFAAAQEPVAAARLREEYFQRLGAPDGAFTLGGLARMVRAVRPD